MIQLGRIRNGNQEGLHQVLMVYFLMVLDSDVRMTLKSIFVDWMRY